MTALFLLLDKILDIYLFVIFIWVVFSWLMAFGVLPTHNRLVSSVMDILHRLTQPALQRIRRFLPAFGGVDLSPMVLILLLWFLQNLLRNDIAPLFGV